MLTSFAFEMTCGKQALCEAQRGLGKVILCSLLAAND